jgi:hypothetical protein
VEVRGQVLEDSAFLPLCGIQGSSQSHQAWQQVSLSTKPSCQSLHEFSYIMHQKKKKKKERKKERKKHSLTFSFRCFVLFCLFVFLEWGGMFCL